MRRGFFILLGWLILTSSCGDALAQSSGAQGACDASKDFGCMAKDVNKSLNDTFGGLGKPLPVVQSKVAGVTMKQVLIAGNEPATQIYSEALPSVLLVVARGGDTISQGSGVAVASDIVVTNCHVVSPDEPGKSATAMRFHTDIVVMTSDRRKAIATLVEHYEDIDTCFLRVSGLNLSPIKAMRPFGWLKVGESVYALGSPDNLRFSFTQGVLSQLRPDFNYAPGNRVDVVQFSAPIHEGSSGGALLDGDGNLIGITSSGLEQQGFNFAIAADLAWRRYGK